MTDQPITTPESIPTKQITKAEDVGLFTIINQVRALQGWTLATADELEPVILTWWKQFARHSIPPEHYQAVYERALDARVRAMNAGAKNIPNVDAIAMIAQWQVLRDELRSQVKQLPATAASDCETCFGSGMEVIEGKGARPCTQCQEKKGVN